MKNLNCFVIFLVLQTSVWAFAEENLCNKIFQDYITKNKIGTSLNDYNSFFKKTIEPFSDILGARDAVQKKVDNLNGKTRDIQSQLDANEDEYRKTEKSATYINVGPALKQKKRLELKAKPETAKKFMSASDDLYSVKNASEVLGCNEPKTASTKACAEIKRHLAKAEKDLQDLAETVQKEDANLQPTAADLKAKAKYDQKKAELTAKLKVFRSNNLTPEENESLYGSKVSFVQEVQGKNDRQLKLATFKLNDVLSDSDKKELEALKIMKAGLEKEKADSSSEMSALPNLSANHDTNRLQMVVADSKLPQIARDRAQALLNEIEQNSSRYLMLRKKSTASSSQLEIVNSRIDTLSQPIRSFQVAYGKDDTIEALYFPAPIGVKMTEGCKKIEIPEWMGYGNRYHLDAASGELIPNDRNEKPTLDQSFFFGGNTMEKSYDNRKNITYGLAGTNAALEQYIKWADEAAKVQPPKTSTDVAHPLLPTLHSR